MSDTGAEAATEAIAARYEARWALLMTGIIEWANHKARILPFVKLAKELKL